MNCQRVGETPETKKGKEGRESGVVNQLEKEGKNERKETNQSAHYSKIMTN